MRRLVVPALAAAVVAAAFAIGSPAAQAAPAAEDRGSYIVVLHDSVPSARAVADEHRRNHRAEVGHVYEHALKGYSARVSGRELGALRSDPRVRYVEADGVVTKSGTQTNPTWGLDRIDDRAGLDNSYDYHTAAGAGVTAYVIDTGIRLDHAQFAGRVSSLYDAVDGGTADDCDGHGTHVAGTIGGETYGVAKSVSLVAVRVLDCNGSGTWSGVIAGIDKVVLAHDSGPAVANLSLGGGASTAVDDAVKGLIADGVTTVVAAGNGNQGGKAQDACDYSPARVPDALTIGATDKTDTKTSWSNYGPCVDFFAPGYQILSAWISGTQATATLSGTSMAAPHVAGAAVLYLSKADATAPVPPPSKVATDLSSWATKGIVKSSSSANNHLLYTCPSGGDCVSAAPDPAPAPTKPGRRK